MSGCERKEDWDRFIEPINIAVSRLVPRESASTSKKTKKQKKKRSKSSKKNKGPKSSKSTLNAVLDNGFPIWKRLVIEPDVIEFKVRNGRSWTKGMKIRNGNRERLHIEFAEEDNRECFKFISMKRQDFKKTVDANEVLTISLKPNSRFIKQNAARIDSLKLKMWIIVMNQQKTRKTRKCVRVQFVRI